MGTGNKPSLCNSVLERTFEAAEGALIGGTIQNHLTESILRTKEEFGIRLARFQGDISLQETAGDLVSEDFLRVEAGHRMGKEEHIQGSDVTAQIMAQSTLIRAAEFEWVDWKKEQDGAVQRMVLRLKHPGEGIEVQVIYELQNGEPYLRKWLDIKNISREKVWLVDLDVETFCTSEWQSSSERGVPIFIGDDFFVGLEFPTWSRIAEDGGNPTTLEAYCFPWMNR
ncbi:MAG: hypothetical protein B1H02_06265 [Candidatus Latescibacteria bacterium 4484_107]|nr:MAG: hypothetical protein B1H02_06265 [Candidatus Latescibacteria bacterium 4484_107]